MPERLTSSTLKQENGRGFNQQCLLSDREEQGLSEIWLDCEQLARKKYVWKQTGQPIVSTMVVYGVITLTKLSCFYFLWWWYDHIREDCWFKKKKRHTPLSTEVGLSWLVNSYKFHGNTISENHSWLSYITTLVQIAQKRLYFLRKLRKAKFRATFWSTLTAEQWKASWLEK